MGRKHQQKNDPHEEIRDSLIDHLKTGDFVEFNRIRQGLSRDEESTCLNFENEKLINIPARKFKKSEIKGSFDGFDLRYANLKGANLAGSHFKNAEFQEANLEKADLQMAVFREANLHKASLKEANLRGTDLAHADLSHSNLEGVEGLQSLHLGGTDLDGAKVDEKFNLNDCHLMELSRNARTLFNLMMVVCIFCLLTSISIDDYDLIAKSGRLTLPIVNASIPVDIFFVMTPLLLFSIYGYFIFYLRLYWRELVQQPAVYPCGKTLPQKVYPWMVSVLVYDYFSRLRKYRKFWDRVQGFFLRLLVWCLGPLTLAVFWFTHLICHRKVAIYWHIGLWIASIVFGACFYIAASLTLRGGNRPPRFWQWAAIKLATIVLSGFFAVWGTLYVTERVLFGPRFERSYFDRYLYANVSYKHFTNKPEHWTFQNPSSEEALPERKSYTNLNLNHANAQQVFMANIDLTKANLEGVNFSGAVLYKADLSNAQLTNAQFDYSDLRKVNLIAVRKTSGITLTKVALNEAQIRDSDFSNASMEFAVLDNVKIENSNLMGAKLSHAQFKDAYLRKTNLAGAALDHADFSHADMVGTDLTKANLEKTVFHEADLSQANFSGAETQGATFFKAIFQGATFTDNEFKNMALNNTDFMGAQLENVSLLQANLAGSNFRQATLRGVNLEMADLSSTVFTHAILDGVNLRGANLKNARLCDIDLSGVDNLNRKQLQEACFNANTILPPELVGLEPPTNCCRLNPSDLVRE